MKLRRKEEEEEELKRRKEEEEKAAEMKKQQDRARPVSSTPVPGSYPKNESNFCFFLDLSYNLANQR